MRTSSELELQSIPAPLFEKTIHTLKQGIAEKVASAISLGFWTPAHPTTGWISCHGTLRYDRPQDFVTPSTVFDLASISKVYCTTSAIAALVDRGSLKWETKLKSIFPRFKSSDIRMKHLLSHSAGFIAWKPFWEEIRAHYIGQKLENIPVSVRQKLMRSLIMNIEPDCAIETKILYSDISFLLLGYVVEEITGLEFDQAVKSLVWDPMGIKNSYFNRTVKSVEDCQIKNVAATEVCPWRGGTLPLQGQVHDDNTWAMGGYAGHAGAFGTLQDLLYFGIKLLNGHFSNEVTKAMWRPFLSLNDTTRTMGWDMPSEKGSMLGDRFQRNSVGHWGYTGTSFWMDLETPFAVTLLTNRVHPSRENNSIREFRARVHTALCDDLERVLGCPIGRH
jgi:serine-type D-Ala-D-Ala carboxypeptidase